MWFDVSVLFVQNEMCVAFGPGNDMFESTRIIGEKQYSLGKVTTVCSIGYTFEKQHKSDNSIYLSQALYDNATIGLAGPVGYVHSYVDFGNVSLNVDNQMVRSG